MNWKAWLYSLVYSVVGGSANSAAAMLVAPETFNFNDLPKLGKLLGAGAVVSLILYLKQSPLPKQEGGETGQWKNMSVLALCLALFTGCAALSEKWASLAPTTQSVLKAGAKLALSYGVAELGDRVKEVRPFQDRLKGLIETTFAKPLTAEETGKALKAGVAATVPPELREPVLAQFRESLAGGKTTAASPEANQDFNRRVASNL